MNEEIMDKIIKKLTADSNFELVNTISTSDALGDMLVEVSYKRDIRIIFTRDRSQCMCDIKLLYNKYNIQDFLAVIGIEDSVNFGDFISMMESVKRILVKNDDVIYSEIGHLDILIDKLDARQKKSAEKLLKRFW
jgi:hypothetical protein